MGMYGPGFGFGGFGMFQVMFTIVFLLCTGTFVVILVKGISEWNKNNHSPRLTVPATIVARRTNVSVTVTAVRTDIITIILLPLTM